MATPASPGRLRCSDLLLWALFVGCLGASLGSSAVLDDGQKGLATYGGSILALIPGGLIARKPKINAFLSTRPVLWFLFLFNAAVTTFCAVSLDGTQGIAATVGMGLVSLGAAGGLVQRHRERSRAEPSLTDARHSAWCPSLL
ncbi:hypothetical protein ACGFZJ_34315 [Streptomyces sp. NPDC048253]|uniref:hypothetical protein n=1 Tax=Streptomyces sp. NPDC048253 TaxID=3365524 RepID=UPI0037111F33